MATYAHQFFADSGTGEPLILLHGHTLDHRIYREAVPHLTASHRVITPDVAGHGRSGLSPEGRPLAGDVADLLDHLGIACAHIAGLSMGGAIAVSFALHYPERTRSLIAIDATLFGQKFDTWKGPRPYIGQARTDGLRPALHAWLNDILFAPALASSARSLVETIVLDYPGTAWLGPTPAPTPPGPPEADRLEEIDVPTLILVGEHDLPDFHRIADRMERLIPNARRQVIAGAGHLVPAEQPQAFAQAVRSFTQGIAAQPGPPAAE